MRKRVLRVTAAAGVLVLLGGGVAAYAARGEDAAAYRYVVATTGDVSETLAATGTVDAAGRADVEVAVDGTMARVRAHAGQRVRAGQVLATLDRTDPAAQVTQAKAQLARARAQLAADLAAQEDAVVDAASSSTPSAQPSAEPSRQPSSEPSQPSGPDPVEEALAALHEQQAAVTSAQSRVSDALDAASTALDAQTAACAEAFTDPTETPTETPSATASADPTASDEDSSDTDQACTDALALVQERQQEAADAETALADALADLTDTLTHAAAAVEGAAADSAAGEGSTPSAAPSTSPAADQAADQSTPTSDGADTSVSAGRLASDQAGIDQAKADLIAAQQTLTRTVIRAPSAGRVVQVDLAPGDQVAGGDVAFVIRSSGAVTVATTIPETQIRQVRLGQKVRVTPTGALRSSIGTITAIGLVADTSTGTASYPVTVTVPHPQDALLPGASASLQIVISKVADVVTLPVSAVTRTGDAAIVRRLENGVLTPVPVTLGAVGTRTVEVVDGLAAGDQVVLADLDQAITDAGTQTGDRPTFFGPGNVSRMPDGAAGGTGPTLVTR